MVPTTIRSSLITLIFLSASYCGIWATYVFNGDLNKLEKYLNDHKIDYNDPEKNFEAVVDMLDRRDTVLRRLHRGRHLDGFQTMADWLKDYKKPSPDLEGLGELEALEIVANSGNDLEQSYQDTVDQITICRLPDIQIPREAQYQPNPDNGPNGLQSADGDGDDDDDEEEAREAREVMEMEEMEVKRELKADENYFILEVKAGVRLFSEVANILKQPCKSLRPLFEFVDLTARTINYSTKNKRKVDAIGAHYVSKVLEHCKLLIETKFQDALRQYQEEPSIIDKLEYDQLIKFFDLDDQQGKPSTKISFDKLPTIFRQLTKDEWNTVYAEKSFSLMKFKHKISPNLQNLARTWQHLETECKQTLEEGLGFFATFAPTIEAFAPNQFNKSLKIPKVFEQHIELYKPAFYQAHLCNNFLDLIEDQRTQIFKILFEEDANMLKYKKKKSPL